MTVMGEKDRAEDRGLDFRSRPHWSANKKMDSVLRLRRAEPLDRLLRKLGVVAG